MANQDIENLVLDSDIKCSGERFYYLPIPKRNVDNKQVEMGKIYRVTFREVRSKTEEKKGGSINNE